MQRVTTSLGSWLDRYKKKIGIIALGHGAKKVEEYFFDWFLYGAVNAWALTTYGVTWGYLVTFAIMTPISAVMCYIYIKAYDWVKIDAFGFEMIKKHREEPFGQSTFAQMLHRIVKLGDFPAFILLSIHMDPFMTTVYLRKDGHDFQGLTKRDWGYFWASVIVSNAYWTLRWTIIIAIIAYVSSWLGYLPSPKL